MAEHTFNVIWICEYLLPYTKRVEAYPLIRKALIHDASEALTGDIPSTAKDRQFAQRDSDLSADVIVLKVADQLEALLFTNDELCMGNQSILPVQDHVMQRYREIWEYFPWNGDHGEKPSALQFSTQFLREVGL